MSNESSQTPTERLIAKINEAPVVIFMKGTAQFPQCGFSARAVQVLKMAGANNLVSVDILSDEPIKLALKEHTKWPTFPQVFIGQEFVGGCDIVCEMHEAGELEPAIQKAKAAVTS